jgi:hypothetical protein
MLLFILFFAITAVAFPITIVEPTKEEVENNYYAGTVGPGQVLLIAIDKQVFTGGRFGKGGYYDKAYVTSLPKGWKAENSKVFDNPLQVYITVPEHAKEGNYSLTINLEDLDNAELLGNKSINVTITVSKDVIDAELKKTSYVIGPKQPLRLNAIITNKGNAGDIFIIEVQTQRETKKKEVFIPAKQIAEISQEISFPGKGVEKVNIAFYSKHAPNEIREEKNITVIVQGNFFEDLGASGTGVLLLFIPFQPLYNLSYLIYAMLTTI